MGDFNRLTPNQIPELTVLGRSNGERNPLTLFWTASGFEVGYRGSELWCEFETDYNEFEQWISIYVNHAFLSRMMLPRGKSEVCLFRNMKIEKDNIVTVRKEVQPMPGDEKGLLQVLAFKGDGTFFRAPEHRFKLEFIGDSMTSGEGSYGAANEMDWIAQWFSASHTYPYLVARELDAEYRIVSQSGYGLCSAWDNNPWHIIPPFYGQVCGVLEGERNEKLGAKAVYNFSEWQPDAILINLGTNDAGGFDQPAFTDLQTGKTYRMEKNPDGTPKAESLERIYAAAVDFLQTVRQNNPEAMIFWCFGLMGEKVAAPIQKAIADYCSKNGDKNISYIALKEIEGDGIGARSHPSEYGHMLAAKTIVEEMRKCKLFEKAEGEAK